MRRIDWTETMLSRLAELYPVETTAHTAYMLQIGVTAVKEKARELGLEKLAKSRWLERAGHISRHFDNRSYAEMAGDLGVSRTTVSRMARKLGLSRTRQRVTRCRPVSAMSWYAANGAGLYSVLTPSHASRLSHTAPRSGYAPGSDTSPAYTGTYCTSPKPHAGKPGWKPRPLYLDYPSCLFPKTIHHYPMPYSHAVRTNRFYPFRGNGLLLRLPHLHGHQESAGGPERGKGEPYGRRDRHIGRGKELPSDQSQQGRGEERRSG